MDKPATIESHDQTVGATLVVARTGPTSRTTGREKARPLLVGADCLAVLAVIKTFLFFVFGDP